MDEIPQAPFGGVGDGWFGTGHVLGGWEVGECVWDEWKLAG